MTNSKEYDDILSTLCVFNILYNTGHSLQQLENIAKIKSQQTSTIMGEKMYNCITLYHLIPILIDN